MYTQLEIVAVAVVAIVSLVLVHLFCAILCGIITLDEPLSSRPSGSKMYSEFLLLSAMHLV